MMVAKRLKSQWKLVLDLLGYISRYGNTARFGQLLQASGNVDAFTVPVVTLNDNIAEVDAHAQVDPLLCHGSIAVGHLLLHCDRAGNCIDCTAEFCQKSVAHELEDAAMMPGDLWLKNFLSVGSQAFEGFRLLSLHQAAVADHIGSQDGDEPAFHS
jgi:hypothetical protein